MMCEVQTISREKIIKQEVKSVDVRSADIADIIGCSAITANKIMRSFREHGIVGRRDKAWFLNPKFVRVHNSLAAVNTVALFEHEATPKNTSDTVANIG